MDIYLVRVSERPDRSLFIERKPSATTNDDYIAISHVWGMPETIQPTHVDGAGTVQLSPGKKDILSILRRRDICGQSWFWMDLFCIDQTEGALISIADQLMAIPATYKSSRCIKVLIETPVCETWQTQASRVISSPPVDMEVFGEEELRHGRKCPNLLFRDPWFERLWTRQEGLYGVVLEIVVLNPVTCKRLETPATLNRRDGWIAEGTGRGKRAVAEFFLDDKLAYHGVSQEEAKSQIYLDFVYRHRVDVTNYGSLAGPAPNYSPISEAWKSSRITTKPRDYVLAVFPDISGYQVPSNARKMPFHELVANALGQSVIRERFHIASKIPKGLMVEASSKESATPWIPREPSSISEAYNSFLGRVSGESKTEMDTKFFAVTHSIRFEELDFSEEGLPEIENLWVTTADIIRHTTGVLPSGPCVGSARENVQTDQGVLHQYFLLKFGPPALERFLSRKLGTPSTASVFTRKRVQNISSEVYGHELRRFLVCLICGTSLHTADLILESADFRIISTPYGKLIALIRRETLSKAKQEDLVLISTSLWHLQGFLIGLKKNDTCLMVGRTAIPESKFWDSAKEGKEGA